MSDEQSAADRLDARAVPDEPETRDDVQPCAAVHPLANVACNKPRGHKGEHTHDAGVRLRWHDALDNRSR